MDEHLPSAFVFRLAAGLAEDARVEGLWLEGPDESIQWPPYERLDLHFAVPEPSVEAFRHDLPGLLEQAGKVHDVSQQQAPLQGFAGTALLQDGTRLTYRIERTSQLGKVPRRAVNVLLDRTGGLLLPALSIEARPAAG